MKGDLTVAFFGMGLLGSNFTRALRDRDVEVRIWNRTPARAEALADTGARVCATPAEAVRGALRLHLTLKDDASVDEVLEAALPGFAPGLVIVDHTTTSAEGAVRRTREWGARGYPYLHAPVFMGPKNALEAGGMMLAGGDRDLFDRLAAALAPMTGTLKWVGPDPGRAASLKLVGNLFILALSAGLLDVMSLTKALGLGAQEVSELFDELNVAAWVPARRRKLYESDPARPTWELAMARKDAGLMADASGKAGRPLLVIPALIERMDGLIAAGDGALDYTVLARDLR